MKKANKKQSAPKALVAVQPVGGDLVFEVEARELKALLARRAVRRRTLVQRHRDILSRLGSKSTSSGLNELTRERLERSIRVNEDYADFLAFARVHLVRPRGASRLTPSDLRVLDLLPSQTCE